MKHVVGQLVVELDPLLQVGLSVDGGERFDDERYLHAAAEAAEWEQLESAVASAGGRHVALFLHKPLYNEGPGDDSRAPKMLPKPAMERLHALIQQSDVRLVASGHLHEHRVATIEGVHHVWAPSTGFVTDEAISTPIGTRRVGFVKYDFGADDVEIEVVCPDDMVTHQFLDHPDMYPRFQEAARRVIAHKRAREQKTGSPAWIA